jgi:hypothetical protein
VNVPYFFAPSGIDPALYAADQWGMLGTSSKRLYQIHAYSIYQSGSLVSSDEKLKENIVELGPVTERIKKIKTVKYDLKKQKSEVEDAKKEAKMEELRKNKIGFLAQNLKENFPEVVEQSEETGTMYVNYDAMVPILLKAILELQAKVEVLETAAQKKGQ